MSKGDKIATRVGPCKCHNDDGLQLHFSAGAISFLVGALKLTDDKFWKDMPEEAKNNVKEFAQIIIRDIKTAMVTHHSISRGEYEEDDEGPNIIVAEGPDAIMAVLQSFMKASSKEMN